MNEYSLQSPFLYSLYLDTIKPGKPFPEQYKIEEARNDLLKNNAIIQTEVLGADSTISQHSKRSVSSIAKGGISEPKYSYLIYRLILELEAKSIWEFGTSLGINTLYMSSIKNTHVTTFEGCSKTLEIAKTGFKKFSRRNITCVEGNIDETILAELTKTTTLDLVFFDANHRSDPTLNYFQQCMRKSTEKSVFIFDDIHWSEEMNQTWEQIKKDPGVSVTIDLFQLGLVFFDHSLTKENFILKF